MTRVLELLRERGFTLLVRPVDGIVREDGSHLTQDAPTFFAAMQKRGLVSRYRGP
jgi:hypothetical protein